MIESISAITLATHNMSHAVRFYRPLGFEIVYGGEDAAFTSFRAGTSLPNLNSLQSTKSVGLEIAQGLMYVSAWAPDLTPESRAFMAKFIERERRHLGRSMSEPIRWCAAISRPSKRPIAPTPKQSSPRCEI